mgnify:CR=1 FL=1
MPNRAGAPRRSALRLRAGNVAVLALLGLGAIAHCGGSSGNGPGAAAMNDAIWPMHPIDARFRGANALGPGDVNGDGYTDYVTNYEFDQRYVVQLHPGPDADPRRPWPSVVAYFLGGRQNGTDTENAALADLDCDGTLDVIGAQGWHTTAWWEGQAPGVRIVWSPPRAQLLDPAAWVDGGRIPGTVDAGHFLTVDSRDVNGDGAPDILVGGRVHNGNGARAGLKWIEAPLDCVARRDLTRWTVHDIDPDQLSGHGFVLTDVDEDGDLDIADANADFDTPDDAETVHWYENPGTGSDAQKAPWRKHEIYRGPEFYFKPQVAAADLDGDGHEDLVTAVAEAIYWFRKTGTQPVTWQRVVIEKDPVARQLQRPIRVVDLNGDGKLDLLGMATHSDGVTRGDQASVFWMEYRGDAPRADNWITHPIKWGAGRPMQLSAFGEKWDQVAFDDVDRDGDLDILANCEEWWEDAVELVAYHDPRVRPTSVGTVWFENRLNEPPYRVAQTGAAIAVDAEHFSQARDGTWYKQSRHAGFSGDGYAQDHNSQTRGARAWDETRGLEYEIEARGGTYAVWVRRLIPADWGRQLGGEASNSAWLGVDGAAPAMPLDDQPAAPDTWAWVRAGQPLRLARGTHTLTLRTREGGYAIDRIQLTTELDRVPE